MKTLFLLIALFSFQTPEPKILNGVITETGPRIVIVWEDKTQTQLTQEQWMDAAEWHYSVVWPEPAIADGVPAIYVDNAPRVGRKLKAEVVIGGKLPVAPCEVRVREQVADWSKEHPGAQPPIGRWTPPSDCQKGSQ